MEGQLSLFGWPYFKVAQTPDNSYYWTVSYDGKYGKVMDYGFTDSLEELNQIKNRYGFHVE